jgi:hypothetical protein
MFERKQDQLRHDVREFERLSQELCKQNQIWNLDLKSGMNAKFDHMQSEIDSLTYDNTKVNSFVQQTKSNLAKVNGSIGLVKYNVEQIDVKIKDFCKLEQNFSDTEKYLGYILPIQI